MPAVSEELRTLATQLSNTDHLSMQRHQEVIEHLERLERKIDEFCHASRILSHTSPGPYDPQQSPYRTQEQDSPARPLTPPQPQPSGQPARSPPEPVTLGPQPINQPPQLYRLPRNTTSIVELLQIWHEGTPDMPSVTSLEQRLGCPLAACVRESVLLDAEDYHCRGSSSCCSRGAYGI